MYIYLLTKKYILSMKINRVIVASDIKIDVSSISGGESPRMSV